MQVPSAVPHVAIHSQQYCRKSWPCRTLHALCTLLPEHISGAFRSGQKKTTSGFYFWGAVFVIERKLMLKIVPCFRYQWLLPEDRRQPSSDGADPLRQTAAGDRQPLL